MLWEAGGKRLEGQGIIEVWIVCVTVLAMGFIHVCPIEWRLSRAEGWVDGGGVVEAVDVTMATASGKGRCGGLGGGRKMVAVWGPKGLAYFVDLCAILWAASQ